MKYIYPLLFVLAFTNSSFAQKTNDDNVRNERREQMENRIESQKIAFITQKLDLSPVEAQQFWPIYNEFQTKMKKLRRQNKLDFQNEDISESDANGFLEKLLSQEQKEVDVRKQYFTELKSVVSTKQVAKLYILEKKFKKEIIAKIKNKMTKKKRKMRKNGF